jgi:hypothetical protein
VSYLDWHVGMKVVFVGYPIPSVIVYRGNEIPRVAFLTVGEVYTILGIGIRERFAKGKWAGPSIYVGFEDVEYGRVWHHHSGFRPVQHRKTDIGLFQRMLTDTKQKADA